jgi:hypothetical protein
MHIELHHTQNMETLTLMDEAGGHALKMTWLATREKERAPRSERRVLLGSEAPREPFWPTPLDLSCLVMAGLCQWVCHYATPYTGPRGLPAPKRGEEAEVAERAVVPDVDENVVAAPRPVVVGEILLQAAEVRRHGPSGPPGGGPGRKEGGVHVLVVGEVVEQGVRHPIEVRLIPVGPPLGPGGTTHPIQLTGTAR